MDFDFKHLLFSVASKCKKHISKHGYSYEEFYAASTQNQKPDQKTGIVFELHLAILAPSNGHILLSAVPKPSLLDPVYEIG